MFSRPALGLAEIAWRWAFGAAAIVSSAFLILEYFRTLPVSAADLFLLRTRHPLLISRALGDIFQGSAIRLGKSVFLLFILLSIAWIVLASWARRGTVNALLNYFQEDGALTAHTLTAFARQRSPFGLNLLRVGATVSAALACLGTFVLAGAASPPGNPAPAAAMLVFLTLVTGIFLAWWLLNWIFSLAAIFAVADGCGTFQAIAKAVDLWRVRWGSIVAAGAWFGVAHTIIFFIATSAIAVPLAFAGIMPLGVILGGVLLVALLYFAAADFLYAGKMAAYVAIAELPYEASFLPFSPTIAPAGGAHISVPDRPAPTTVDRSELILSDVPPNREET